MMRVTRSSNGHTATFHAAANVPPVDAVPAPSLPAHIEQGQQQGEKHN